MTTQKPDSAAIFAASLSLWNSLHRGVITDRYELSELFEGIDEMMRVVMKVATTFETWACEHVNFDETSDVWPYLLEGRFGDVCLGFMQPGALLHFDFCECRQVADKLGLPLR